MDPEGKKVFVSKSGDVSTYRSSTSKRASQGEDTLRRMTVDIESPQSKVNYGTQYTIIPLHLRSCISRFLIDVDFSIEKVSSGANNWIAVMQEVQFKISE